MRAIVLSGGGAKGAYQAGSLKALRKLGIEFDIVTGTSIGALNGFLLVQNDLFKCLKFWHNISFDQIYDDFENAQTDKEIQDKYIEKLLNGGIRVKKIVNLIDKYYNPRKMYKSKTKFGVVSFNLSKLKPVMVSRDEVDFEELKNHIIASAMCFPVLKPIKINNELHIDGGYYDNLPINLAVSLGADEVIAIDLKAIGIKQKVKDKNIKVLNISPNNNLANFLMFDKQEARKMIKFGYNDTLKVYKQLDGKLFTFKKNHLLLNYNKYNELFVEITRKYINQDKSVLKLITNFNDIKYVVNKQNVKIIMNNTLEKLGKIFNLDETLIYDIRRYNKYLIHELDKVPLIEINGIEIKELLKLFDEKSLIKYLYINLNDEIDKKIYKIICLFPKEFLMAVYLKSIRK